jgi:hypothetical protein
MKNSVLWDITLCILVKVIRRLRGIYGLHFQGLRVRQARSEQEAEGVCRVVTPCSLGKSLVSAWLTLRPSRWRLYVPQRRSVDFHRTTRRYIPDG